MPLFDPRQPVSETVDATDFYARVWYTVCSMSMEQRATRTMTTQVEGEIVTITHQGEVMTIERLTDDRYVVEATSISLASMVILSLV
jgi:hypothetical protein